MTKTESLELNKPEAQDFFNIEDFNYNADVIDAAIKALQMVKVEKEERDKWNGKADNEIATTQKDGLMSAADKKKIDGIEDRANKYELPKAGKDLGGVRTTSNVVKADGLIPTPIIEGIPYYKDTTYTPDKLINALPASSADVADNDTFVSHTGNGDEFYRRPLSKLWDYIKQKADKAYALIDHSHTKVNGHTVNADVPSGAKFTDTDTWRPLGTTADTACAGNDSRLSNARPASDVYAWAKASSKPSYTKSEVGLGNVDNTADSAKSVKYATSAGSASSSSKATGLVDYGATTKTIQIGYSGDGISGDAIKYIAGYTTGNGSDVNAKIKDVSKDALKSWLGLGSLAYSSATIPTIPSSLPANGGNSATVNGHTVNSNVPANAKFTDTNTWRGIQNNLTSTSTTDSLSAAQGKALNDKIAALNSNLDYSQVTNVKINAGTTNIMSHGIDAGTYLMLASAQLLQTGATRYDMYIGLMENGSVSNAKTGGQATFAPNSAYPCATAATIITTAAKTTCGITLWSPAAFTISSCSLKIIKLR